MIKVRLEKIDGYVQQKLKQRPFPDTYRNPNA